MSHGAIAFLGPAGQGKSTLAASFAQKGYPLLTDDCLLVSEQGNEPFVAPSYPGVRLWPDATTELFGPDGPSVRVTSDGPKQRFGPENSRLAFARAPLPLRRLYCLVPGAALSITPQAPSDAFVELVRAALALDVRAPEWLEALFSLQARLAQRDLIRRLQFPVDLTLLPEVRAAILADVEGADV